MTKPEESPQARAVKDYRHRLQADGLARFEVLGRETDRGIIRALAKRLAEAGAEADALRADLAALMDGEFETGAKIQDAFQQSPLVGSGIKFERERTFGRKIEL